MPDPEHLKRFFNKRGIRVLSVKNEGKGLRIEMVGDVRKACEIWAQTRELCPLIVIPVGKWRRTWLKVKSLLRRA